MTISDAMRQFVTKPVELLMEVVYAISLLISDNKGCQIIFLSIVINIAALRLYRWGDSVQVHAEAQENGNTIIFSKRKIVSFLFERIPISLIFEILLFTAAYIFFTDPYRIWGGSFFLIQNLGMPDALLPVGIWHLNIVPICTFAIRIISETVYIKGHNCRFRAQNLLIAFLFFVTSYNLLSAFTLYRLVGELVYLLIYLFAGKKIVHWVFCIGISVLGPLLSIYKLFFVYPEVRDKAFILIALSLLMQIPLIICIFIKKRRMTIAAGASRQDHLLFLINVIYLTILTGVLIPSTVIRSAPTDFITVGNCYSPLWYVVSTFLLAGGTFLLWILLIYFIAPSPIKRILALVMTVISVCGTVNSMFLGNDRGVMTRQLQYERLPADKLMDILINIMVLALIALALLMLWKKKTAFISFFILVLCITKVTSSIMNILNIEKILNVEMTILTEQMENNPEISLSKQGKNVIVFMLDRSIGYFIPFMMAERPELAEKFDGFTFYPNTVSFGTHTNEAAPALFGGYEYRPEKINARDDILLAEKHDEALRLLPVLFDEAGYDATVIDPPYAGYMMLSDLGIYNDHPDIHAFRAAGNFSSSWKKHDFALQTLQRNFFCFSLYRIAPLFLQPIIYGRGTYNQMNLNQAVNTLCSSQGIQDSFEQEYSVLLNLSDMTKVIDENKNFFLSISNKTAHEAALLQLPDYIPAETVNNCELEPIPVVRTSADGRMLELNSSLKITHYHANMAAFLLLGEWLDYLRDNDVYDNTRIIIAADHGFTLGFTDMEFDSSLSEEILTYNPVLMVKDFNAVGLAVDERFMTNADVPLIALDGLIPDPVNPATGNPVEDGDKTGSDLLIMHSEDWDIRSNKGNTFLPGRWFRLSGDDIFETENWKFVGVH